MTQALLQIGYDCLNLEQPGSIEDSKEPHTPEPNSNIFESNTKGLIEPQKTPIIRSVLIQPDYKGALSSNHGTVRPTVMTRTTT